jgi:hypothetical protein
MKALWRGDLPLGDAFWNWAVLGAFLINLSTSILSMVLISMDQLWPAFIVGYALSVPYNFVVLVGVWRSAAQYGGPFLLAEVARWISLMSFTVLSVT